MIEMQLHFPPSGNHRNGYNRKTGKYYRKPKYQQYLNDVALIKIAEKIETVMGEIEVHLHFYKPSSCKFDEDNIKKSLYDALQFARIIEGDDLIKSGAFSFDEKIVKGGLILIRIRAHEEKEPFWAW